jgi:coenzyme PQQ precursor peptide PqqA
MLHFRVSKAFEREHVMAWTTPVLVEICIGMEINAYAPAEF